MKTLFELNEDYLKKSKIALKNNKSLYRIMNEDTGEILDYSFNNKVDSPLFATECSRSEMIKDLKEDSSNNAWLKSTGIKRFQ